MNTFDALNQRISANFFDTERKLSSQQLTNLINYAQQAPSAFNIQHSRYLVVTDQSAKEQLKSIAFNQQKVSDAPAVIIVLADERGHERMAEIAQQGVDQGIYDNNVRDYFVNATQGAYADNPTAAHDEALRSASLAAMNLMTAATAMGLASGPMIGFDSAQLKQTFNIGERYNPAMMIAVGYARPGNWQKKPRLAAAQVAVMDVRPARDHALSS